MSRGTSTGKSFELTNWSQLTFSSTLTLGDAGTGTGTLSIDPTSTVFAGAGTHAIVPFTAGQPVTVTNAGTIDLTNGGVNATDSLSIAGQLRRLGRRDGYCSRRCLPRTGRPRTC